MVDQPVSEAPYRGVTITDVDIPFWRMVSILIKWVFAALVAYIVIMLIVAAIAIVIALVMGSMAGDPQQLLREWMNMW